MKFIPFLREILERLVDVIPYFRRTGSFKYETVKIKATRVNKPPFLK